MAESAPTPAPLLPDLDDETARPFWDACARHELVVQRCDDCGLLVHPPRPMCPRCRSLRRGWAPMSGRATVWSYVVTHPPLLPAYTDLAPYVVVIVQLDEDPTLRMVGNLVAGEGAAINSVDPSTVQIGEPVRVVWEVVDDVTLPRWVRA
ncbi:MAG TPA: OB-fold domain-containing protein [Acidimicrobiia bacterium]|jgi:hypothetical protein